MGRVKDWLLEMEEYAAHLPLKEWIAKHGSYRKEVWDRIHNNLEEDQFDLGL